ncbi:unnamed protein product [Oikopleura dioica]|uniref:Uncharacterized protein n=1 Tax=Oikopleura dioica TaxID=34765 RepID=E4YA04_OIKDI|nr:unnamed protein product [Oikopleura dioica]
MSPQTRRSLTLTCPTEARLTPRRSANDESTERSQKLHLKPKTMKSRSSRRVLFEPHIPLYLPPLMLSKLINEPLNHLP